VDVYHGTDKMVNWQGPTLLLNDYIALVKLNHVMAGLYIWETVLTAGFELDVLRGKRPYKWTIWLYLGTRYTGLLAFVCFFVYVDAHGIPCQPFITAFFALGYASWAFASFIIALRVIAIWSRNGIVSLITFAVLSGGITLNIRRLVTITGTYNPIVGSCIVLRTHRSLVNAFGILVVDVVLFLAMLIGLLRHGISGGIWKLLYQQCIIWMALAFIAEVPVVVFFILNLNDVWNEMLVGTALAILSIAAARMYRSLSDRGSFTEYVPSNPPQISLTNPTVHCRRDDVYDAMHFGSFTQQEGTRTTYEDPAFLPTDQIRVEFVPSGSVSGLAPENADNKRNSAAFEKA